MCMSFDLWIVRWFGPNIRPYPSVSKDGSAAAPVNTHTTEYMYSHSWATRIFVASECEVGRRAHMGIISLHRRRWVHQTSRYCCSWSVDSLIAGPAPTGVGHGACMDATVGCGSRVHGRQSRRPSAQLRPAWTQPLPHATHARPMPWAHAPHVAATACAAPSHAAPTASQYIGSLRMQCNWQRTHWTWQRRHTAPSSASDEVPQLPMARLVPATHPTRHCAMPLHKPTRAAQG